MEACHSIVASLNHHYYITGCHKIVRLITHGCIIYQWSTAKHKLQLLGQIPTEHITPDSVFDQVGIDYCGHFIIKYGSIRKPSLVKAYVCIFMSVCQGSSSGIGFWSLYRCLYCHLTVFTACRGKPWLLWSDHGTNFIGAVREFKEIITFIQNQISS